MDNRTVFELIAAKGPMDKYAERLWTYGQFVGAWEVESTWFEHDGSSHTAAGQWNFNWVLGGLGVQDVLFKEGAPAYQFGTTLRCYDIALDAWHITWMQPYGGEFVHMLGCQMEDRIVQESLPGGQGRRDRWSFLDIRADSFTWLGEVSLDNGQTWFLEQKMLAHREIL